jgi:hypothetical protein
MITSDVTLRHIVRWLYCSNKGSVSVRLQIDTKNDHAYHFSRSYNLKVNEAEWFRWVPGCFAVFTFSVAKFRQVLSTQSKEGGFRRNWSDIQTSDRFPKSEFLEDLPLVW